MSVWEKFLNNLSRQRLVKLLTSRRFAAVIIVLITFCSIIGMVVPQKTATSLVDFQIFQRDYPSLSAIADKIALTNVFSAWWFLLLLFLTFLSIFFCTLLRLRPQRRTARPLAGEPLLELKETPRLEEIRRLFFRRLYFVSAKKEGNDQVFLRATRGGSYWFSVLFHIGLMISLLGGIADKSSSLSGVMLLTEGQAFTENHLNYLNVVEAPLFNENHQFFNVSLGKVDAKYKQGVMTDLVAELRLTDGGYQRDEKIRVNYPLAYKGFFFLVEKSGFSPQIDIIDRQGKPVLSAFVSLANIKKESFDDNIRVAGYKLKLRLWPNTVHPRQLYLVNGPRLELEAEKGGKTVWKESLNEGQTLLSPVGYITFSDLRRWIYFRVSYNPALDIIFWGLLLASLGITIRLLLVPRDITLMYRRKGKGWEVFLRGQAKWGKAALKKELKVIENYLRDRYNTKNDTI